jgi:glycosyltransferase involved in cell wall biosynthesis
MRILVTNMLRGWGGQSNRILLEAVGLAARGHEVVLAVPEGSKLMERATAAGLECWRGLQVKPPAQLHRFLGDLRRLRAGLARWRPDIIHCNGSPDSWLVFALRAVAPGPMPPVVRTKHNINVWHPHWLNRCLYGSFAGFMVPARFVEAQVRAFPGLGDRPIAVIPSVADTAPIVGAAPADLRGEIGAAPGDFLWGSCARLRHEKGVDVLLRGFARVVGDHPHARLVLAGDGSERAAMEALARELGVAGRVHFLGFRQDVPALLHAFDGFVLASRAEAFGTALVEAMAARRPVVATRVGGVPDCVEDGVSGLLVTPEDTVALAAAMGRVMTDGALRARLAEAGFQRATQEFTVDRMVEAVEAFHQRILAAR